MYPESELTQLAWHKAALRQRISLQRDVVMSAAIDVARPLLWLDRVVLLWRQIRPFAKLAAIPMVFLAKRALFPRFKLFGSLLRWGPALFGAFRMASAMRSK